MRVISATHQNLQQAVEEKKFRQDLFYRLCEMAVFVPPLRERPEDIELLAEIFLQQFSSEFSLGEKILSSGALAKLGNYSWPGNVRELKNICRTAILLSTNQEISAEQIRLGTVPQQQEQAQLSSGLSLIRTEITPSNGPVETLLESGKSLKDLRRDYDREIIKLLMERERLLQVSWQRQID